MAEQDVLDAIQALSDKVDTIPASVWNHSKAAALIEEVHYIERAIHVDTELLVEGIGTQENPFNTLEATLDHMEAKGLRLLHVLSDITLDRNLKNFLVRGIGLPAIDCNGQNVDKSRFDHCTMKGNHTGYITVQESALANNFYLNGNYETCTILGNLNSANNSTIDMFNCFSGIRGLGFATITGVNGSVFIGNHKGSLGMVGWTAGTHSIGLTEGKLVADATNTGGEVHVRGAPFDIVDDSQVGCRLFDETGNKKEREIHAIQGLDSSNPLTITPTLITAGDIVQEVGGNGETISTVSRQ